MRKNEIAFVKSLIEKVNPFKLKNPDGTSFIYQTRREAYLYVIGFVQSNSAMGYLDVAYVIYRLYDSTPRELALDIAKYFQPLGIKVHEVLDPDFAKNKGFYRNFIRALHSMCDTTFDVSQFDTAFDEYRNQLEYKQIKIKTKEDEENEQTK